MCSFTLALLVESILVVNLPYQTRHHLSLAKIAADLGAEISVPYDRTLTKSKRLAVVSMRECQFCFSDAVEPQDDGSYICRVCHAVQEFWMTFEEIDNVPEGQPLFARSFRISHRVSEDDRLSPILLAEAMQLILAMQTVAAESRLGIPISDSVFMFLDKFRCLFRFPLRQESFSFLVLILLSGITRLGVPMTHLDVIRWIRDGIIPFYNPLEFLPQSFVRRLSPSESASLHPKVPNVRTLFQTSTGRYFRHRIHPLPNPKLVLWRIASFLRLPEPSFVSFALSLVSKPPLNSADDVPLLLRDDSTHELYSVGQFMKCGWGLPLAVALFAMTLIYRLDGTDWTHPAFIKLGFPSFYEILNGPLVQGETVSAFPLLNGTPPRLHQDLICALGDAEPIPFKVYTLISAVREGYGTSAALPYDLDSLAPLNTDLRALLVGLSREFGIRELIIMQEFVTLTEKRFGNFAAERGQRMGCRAAHVV
jgi:hypothetical protein